MAKLITLEEAAAMLGVSPEKLSEMRQRQEVFGVRDGGGWKFKVEDIERFKSEHAAGGESKTDVVLSEFELGESGPGSSTVIGGQKPGSDIELKLGGDDGSGLNLSGGSDLGSASTPSGPSGGSALDLSGGSGLNLGGSGSGLDLLGSGSLISGPKSDVKLASGTNLGSGMGSNVLTGGSSSGGAEAGKTMLTAELADKGGGDSAIKMSMRDSESVFGEPDSDVSRHIEGSGINLLDARDSGLNLDDLQLASVSGIGGKKKNAGSSDLEMKGEEDFLLTPLEEQTDDSTDSGSQVIALEGDFGDDATATLMAGDVPGLGQMLEDAGGGPLGGQMSQPGQTVYMAPPEPAYGIGTVVSLGFSSAVLVLVGIMMYDLIRHMWSWDTPYSFNSSIMDAILGMF